jgi:putative DNA primase/helicase
VSKRRPRNVEARGDGFLAAVEPWPSAIDGVQLLDDLAGVITRHVGLPEGGADAVALWAVHTHALDAAAMTPLLAITSPTPECGKSTLLGLVGKLALSPLPASNITPAAVFRAIEKWRPTLLIDEADTFLRDNNELRGVLDSGHGRDSAFVVRTVGDDHEPRHFSTWAAKAIALIGDLTATLASRSIHVEMRRLASGQSVERARRRYRCSTGQTPGRRWH